jgi:DMSO/TMAO reductase YedYZ molybdopterin-dependent catalytic subunit
MCIVVIQKLGYASVTLFLIGLVVGAISLAVSLGLRTFVGGIFIPELASQTLFSLTPGEVESQAVETFGPAAKYSAFIGALIVNLVLYGILSMFLHWLFVRKINLNGYLRIAIIASVITYAVMFSVSFILMIIADLQTLPISVESIFVYLILPQITFGFILSYFYKSIPQHPTPSITFTDLEKKEMPGSIATPSTTSDSSIPDEIDLKKRLFLKAGIASIVAAPVLFFGLNSLLFPREAIPSTSTPSQLESELQSRPRPTGFEDQRLTPLLLSEITPTDLFYRVDINPVPPSVDASSWKLTVKGLVNKPTTITYEELKSMPSIEEVATLGCISNKIGAEFTSNAVWKGIRLKDLLEGAEIKPAAKYIVFRCADGYDVGISLESGLQDGSILAYQMNGSTLTAKHGYPVRAIIPGWYGMMNPKWIIEIELVDQVYEGYWQKKGWTNKGLDAIYSSIVIPGSAPIRQRFRNLEPLNIIVGQSIPIAGVAFAGNRGISKVEVSTDGGNAWRQAVIKNPLSQYAWVLWTTEFNITSKSDYKILVRATDKTGRAQMSEVRNPFPNGATGYHMINIQA